MTRKEDCVAAGNPYRLPGEGCYAICKNGNISSQLGFLILSAVDPSPRSTSLFWLGDRPTDSAIYAAPKSG
jgi:hypothetical protein